MLRFAFREQATVDGYHRISWRYVDPADATSVTSL
jgi:hypothetical protein